MPTVLLLRHGRTTANTAGILAGHMPGVALDETGLAQAAEAAKRLAGLPLVAAVSSPLPRCLETIHTALGDRGLTVETDEDIAEYRYGDWEGRKLSDLVHEPLWKTVQEHPSAAVFPNGDAAAHTAARAVAAVRGHDARIAAEYGRDALWLACTHGDIVKAVVADALGVHFDMFQRISAGTASITAIRYTPERPYVLRLNDTGSDLGDLVAAERNTDDPEPDNGEPTAGAVGGGR
ncbi:MSMEG_4193 family putative phosphomutase [Phytomonospora endophytica]|uniref:Putative phosphomutase (TIGR03848 family) n=1 Tax=Phytomonospora endophytica TaxID=714109 RepID=A0A841FQB0_9ACTN|nr:MSMEG_4193 family putative phosphomutase [Phytomonospora endophytica]MBB6035742.1 putative phosphomutase (TIGR03848 family) [Phytomonospora endophytica]GIG69580.1 phosphatase [Phytomonospora endophytica]